MELREWALIAFSILAQMSAGSFLVLGVVHFFAARKAGETEADRLSDRALVAILVVLGLGLIASLFHLGNPFKAYIAVTNLGSSWLSREIFFGVLFAVLGAIFAFMQWRKLGSTTIRSVFAWIAAVMGIALVYSMSRVYMLPTLPSWNTITTPITFFTTSLLLGSLAVGSAFVANYAYLKRNVPDIEDVQTELLQGSLKWIAIASVVLLGVELIVLPPHFAYLANMGPVAVSSIAMFGSYSALFVTRLILLFVGAGVFGMFLYQSALNPDKENVMGSLTYGAFLLVLIAEVLGRYLFYATQAQITI